MTLESALAIIRHLGLLSNLDAAEEYGEAILEAVTLLREPFTGTEPEDQG